MKHDELMLSGTKSPEWRVYIKDGERDGKLTVALTPTDNWGSEPTVTRQRVIEPDGRVTWHEWKPATETFPRDASVAWEENFQNMFNGCRDMMTALRGAIAAIELHSSDQRPRRKMPAYWFMLALHEDLLEFTRKCGK
jgi:hypothetical protein